MPSPMNLATKPSPESIVIDLLLLRSGQSSSRRQFSHQLLVPTSVGTHLNAPVVRSRLLRARLIALGSGTVNSYHTPFVQAPRRTGGAAGHAHAGNARFSRPGTTVVVALIDDAAEQAREGLIAEAKAFS